MALMRRHFNIFLHLAAPSSSRETLPVKLVASCAIWIFLRNKPDTCERACQNRKYEALVRDTAGCDGKWITKKEFHDEQEARDDLQK